MIYYFSSKTYFLNLELVNYNYYFKYMCLAVPGKIISIDRTTPELTMAKVDFGGIVKNICIQWLEVTEGDYILAHAGMAISAIDAEEARLTWDDLKKLTSDE